MTNPEPASEPDPIPSNQKLGVTCRGAFGKHLASPSFPHGEKAARNAPKYLFVSAVIFKGGLGVIEVPAKR